jgi:outer membrane protein
MTLNRYKNMIEAITKLKRTGLICGMLVAAIGFSASAQETITLQGAIDRALERNLTIKQAQVTEKLATEDYQQAKNNLLPSLVANPQASYNFGRTPNLATYSYTSQSFLYVNGQASASVTLFAGGALRSQILQNKLLLDADKSATQKAKNDLVLLVATDYLNILTSQDLVAAAKQQLAIAQISLDRTQKNYNAGSQSLADLSQAKAGVSTAQLNLTTAQSQLDIAILTLKQYMEMDPKTDIKVEIPDISKITDVKTVYDASEVIKTALVVNPDVQVQELLEKGYAEAIKVARGGYYPTVSLFGGVGTNYSSISQNINGSTNYPFFNQVGNNMNEAVGVSLQIPIFNKFQARTNLRKAKLNYENAQLTTQLTKNTLAKTIYQAIEDLEAAVKRYASTQQTFAADKDALDAMKQRFDIGLANQLDYNTTLTNYEKAQNDMIEAKYEVVFRSKVIDYYLGNKITL